MAGPPQAAQLLGGAGDMRKFGGEANDSIDERLVYSLARKRCPHQWWLPPGASLRRRSLGGTRPRIRIRNTNAVHANPETPRESEDH
jgi:hypothetical protein